MNAKDEDAFSVIYDCVLTSACSKVDAFRSRPARTDHDGNERYDCYFFYNWVNTIPKTQVMSFKRDLQGMGVDVNGWVKKSATHGISQGQNIAKKIFELSAKYNKRTPLEHLIGYIKYARDDEKSDLHALRGKGILVDTLLEAHKSDVSGRDTNDQEIREALKTLWNDIEEKLLSSEVSVPTSTKISDVSLNPYSPESPPFFFRNTELSLLTDFINTSEKFKVWAISGASGSGKTRLAIEWAKDFKSQGWTCIGLGSTDIENPTHWLDWSPDQPTILILDTIFNADALIQKIVNKGKKTLNHKVRFLVIDRSFKSPLQDDKRWGISDFSFSLELDEDIFFRPQALNLDNSPDQELIVKKIICHYCSIDKNSSSFTDAISYLKRERILLPLFAILVVKSLAENKKYDQWNRFDLILHNSWKENLPWDHGYEGMWASGFISAATAASGIEAHTLIAAPYPKESAPPESFHGVLDTCCKYLMTEDRYMLSPLTPSIVGETFFLLFLKHIYEHRSFPNAFYYMFCAGDMKSQQTISQNVGNFLNTLFNNLMNDKDYIHDRPLPSVNNTRTLQDFLRGLMTFMNPSNFPEKSPMREAALVSASKLIEQVGNV